MSQLDSSLISEILGSRSTELDLPAVYSRPGAIRELEEVVKSLKRDGEVVVLSDGVYIDYQGIDLADFVVEYLSDVGVVRTLRPSGGAHQLVLNESIVDFALAQMSGSGCVVAVGAGTISDLGKLLGARADVPVVVVQSAASVNGFSDSLSVLVQGGVKRTVESAWPSALVVDHDIIQDAPSRLNQAGFGDAISALCAPADWYLACHVGMDKGYDPRVVDVVTKAGEALWATAEPEKLDIAALINTLTLGGFCIGIAGTTAPLSGCEHLMSHLLDMAALARGRDHDLHGAQVGVAAVLSAALWHTALDQFDPTLVDPEDCIITPPGLSDTVKSAWLVVDPTGTIGEACARSVALKHKRWSECGPVVTEALTEWKMHADAMRHLVHEPSAIAASLSSIGAPVRFQDLVPDVPRDDARWVLSTLPFMRDRFTLCDLLFVCGMWTESFLDDVFERATQSGGGY